MLKFLQTLCIFLILTITSSEQAFGLGEALLDFQSWAIFIEVLGLAFQANTEQSQVQLKPNLSGQLGFETNLPYFSIGLCHQCLSR